MLGNLRFNQKFLVTLKENATMYVSISILNGNIVQETFFVFGNTISRFPELLKQLYFFQCCSVESES